MFDVLRVFYRDDASWKFCDSAACKTTLSGSHNNNILGVSGSQPRANGGGVCCAIRDSILRLPFCQSHDGLTFCYLAAAFSRMIHLNSFEVHATVLSHYANDPCLKILFHSDACKQQNIVPRSDVNDLCG